MFSFPFLYIHSHTQLFHTSMEPESYFVGDVFIFIQEHLQLADADAQVSICELVRYVETQWPKLPPFQGICMEEAQGEKQGLELSFLQGMEIRQNVD